MIQRERASEQLPFQIERVVRQHMPPPQQGIGLPVLPGRSDRLLSVLEAMGAWITEFDVNGRMLYASPNVERIIGFSPQECLETDCIEFHPDDVPSVVEIGQKVRTTGEPATNQVRVRHKRGHWVWIATTLLGWYADDGGFHTISFTRDITELKTAEAAQRESEARYNVISEMSCDLIVEIDRVGRRTYVGPGSEQIIGYTPEEAVAISAWSTIHPDDLPHVREQLDAAFLSADQGEVEAGHPNHRPRLVEYRIRHRDGHWVWLEAFGMVYPRAGGKLRYLAVSRDVTARKLAERERHEFEESMQRTQKLESLGVLAGGIAHDFNNLLTPILGAAGLGLTDLPEGSPVRGRLKTIQRAAQRAAALTNQMLAYAGQKSLRVERLDLSKLVSEMQQLVATSISGKTTLEVQLESDLPAVEGEPAQLAQIVMNLVTNAAESLADGAGRITVKTGVVDVAELPSGALFSENLKPGRYVCFEVIDSGSGMDDETRSRIFEPFFSTKFTGRGLGLAAVVGIVRAHHGAIDVDSVPGQGTRFRVLLPALAGPVQEARPDRPPIDGWRTSGTVLVIDDDEGVRELARDLLRRAGMSVLTAADGHDGVKLFGEHADDIRVVLLDRTMPALSGADTFEAIRAIRSDAKIVLVSGYSEERVTAELAGLDMAGFLKKPFSPEMLLARVREVIEGD